MYQNCNQIKLQPSLVNNTSVSTMSGDICTIPALSNRDKVKFLFVVDMSASNATPNRPPEVLGSDLLSQRIIAIEQFLQQNCATSLTNAKVAVTGFANTNILRPGTQCNKGQFKSFSDIQSTIDFYKQTDANLRAACNTGGGTCALYTTNYQDAVNCADDIVRDDITNPDPDGKKSFYMTFFLTDGEPRTGFDYVLGSNVYNTFKNTIVSKIQSLRQHAEQMAMGLLFQPIFYGGDYLNRADPTGTKQNLANDILSAMADAGLTNYVLLNHINQLQLCNYLTSGNRIPFVLKTFVATNLTTTKRGDYLLADSDMDGIPDKDEAARGFDSKNPRSMFPVSELLDGACFGMTKSQCLANPKTGCGKPNYMGLTQCEVDKLGLTNALDTNGDGFLDIMRLIKGLSPSLNSPVEDGDSLPERDELLIGRDPNYSDDGTSEKLLVKMSANHISPNLPGCPSGQESIRYNIEHMPLVRTLKTNITDPISTKIPWLKHDQDENIILIYYILTPANGGLPGSPKDQVYAKFLKVHYHGHILGEIPLTGVTERDGFYLIGEIGDSFIP